MGVEPGALFPGRLMIVAPHMDDELLACGGTVALLPQKNEIHVVYVTDGMRSPAPIFPGDAITPDLGQKRMQESTAAMTMLGTDTENLHFLCLPEAELREHKHALLDALRALVKRIIPDQILMPFRYDRHPDHLMVNHALVALRDQGTVAAQLIEYFVYYRWKLLPRKDVRKYIRRNYLFSVDIRETASLKRKALDSFESQTTIFYPWQTRPILTPRLLDEECNGPEYFMRCDATVRGPAVFNGSSSWIRLAHRLEPFLLKSKYITGATFKRLVRRI